jgi:hypothetical protein
MIFRAGDPGTDDIVITCDGMPVPPAVACDPVEEWVDCIVFDDAGHVVPNEARGGCKIERRRGLVVVTRRRA